MNPWALLVILLGLVLIIIGLKGTQHNITAAITGHDTNIPPAGVQSSTKNKGSGKGAPTGFTGSTVKPYG